MQHQPKKVECQNKKLGSKYCEGDFTIEPEDFAFYEKISSASGRIPPPTFCPTCRAQRRLAFRNERKLFRAKDYEDNKEIFSSYPKSSEKKIITKEKWHSDDFDASVYAREYDFSRPFFEQFKELDMDVPVKNLLVTFMENSEYCSNANNLKNCYLVFNSLESQDSMYSNAINFSRKCFDCSHLFQSENSYECFWVNKSYQVFFSIRCNESTNLFFCRDCVSCNDCFGCTNLRNKSYCIFNQQYSKEEYKKIIKEMRLDTIEGVEKYREKARKLWSAEPVRFLDGIKNVDSYGVYVTNCKDVKMSYFMQDGESMKYCQYMQVGFNKDCYDTSVWGSNTQLHYETCVCGLDTQNIKFSFNCWPNCQNVEYSTSLFSCSDCFGCSGLKNKKYCIFNKQYEKDEYFEMVEKIKNHMNEMPYIDKIGRVYKYGEFFPIDFSYVGYNNSLSVQHFPLTKQEAENLLYPWCEEEKNQYNITKKGIDKDVSVKDIDESILKEILECEVCKSAFRIMKEEFIFLKNQNIALPVLCNDCRFDRRIQDRLKIRFYERKCMCAGVKDVTGKYTNKVLHHQHKENACGESFVTGYEPNRSEIVYCERCYQNEIY